MSRKEYTVLDSLLKILELSNIMIVQGSPLDLIKQAWKQDS